MCARAIVQASCPLWDECGGLQKFIERDQQYEDPPHNEVCLHVHGRSGHDDPSHNEGNGWKWSM